MLLLSMSINILLTHTQLETHCYVALPPLNLTLVGQ